MELKFSYNLIKKETFIDHNKLLEKLAEQKNLAVKGVECEINTPIGESVYMRPSGIAQALEKRILDEIKVLKAKRYIKDSRSSWCNNLVPVEKENGKIRIAVNLK